MCAQLPNVIVVIIVRGIVGNEENLKVKIAGARINLGIDENELEIDPFDNLNKRKGQRSMWFPNSWASLASITR